MRRNYPPKEQHLTTIPTNCNRKFPVKGQLIKEGYIIGRGKSTTVVDPADVEMLAELWMSYQEMAAFFGISTENLKYNFMPEILRGRSKTQQLLRRKQIEVALSGNVPMLVWLGKNILFQTDRMDVRNTEVEANLLEAVNDEDIIDILTNLEHKSEVIEADTEEVE